jgi:hypothetical protein
MPLTVKRVEFSSIGVSFHHRVAYLHIGTWSVGWRSVFVVIFWHFCSFLLVLISDNFIILSSLRTIWVVPFSVEGIKYGSSFIIPSFLSWLFPRNIWTFLSCCKRVKLIIWFIWLPVWILELYTFWIGSCSVFKMNRSIINVNWASKVSISIVLSC